jgi:hypothetical protein
LGQLGATWEGNEIEVGLKSMISSYYTVERKDSYGRGRYYLNFRWANFKVNPSKYGWTTKELKLLRRHRSELRSLEGPPDIDIRNNPVEFPITVGVDEIGDEIGENGVSGLIEAIEIE